MSPNPIAASLCCCTTVCASAPVLVAPPSAHQLGASPAARWSATRRIGGEYAPGCGSRSAGASQGWIVRAVPLPPPPWAIAGGRCPSNDFPSSGHFLRLHRLGDMLVPSATERCQPDGTCEVPTWRHARHKVIAPSRRRLTNRPISGCTPRAESGLRLYANVRRSAKWSLPFPSTRTM